MRDDYTRAADAVAMFCRLQMNVRIDLPIRSSEMGVLIYIQKQEEAVTPLMISNFFRIAKPSVTAMVNTLIKHDYLVKVPSSMDRRSYTLSITDRGKELVNATKGTYFKKMELIEERLGKEEFELFIKLIDKVNKVLSEERQS